MEKENLTRKNEEWQKYAAKKKLSKVAKQVLREYSQRRELEIKEKKEDPTMFGDWQVKCRSIDF